MRRGRVATNLAVRIAGGRRPGARSRSPTDCRSISPMMSRCGSLTRRSTRRCMSRAAVPSSASWSRACVPAGRCACRVLAPGKQPGGHVTSEVLISERPAEADDRAVPGHWEGDLIIGLHRSAIGTVVERSTRFTMLLHLPRMPGYGTEPRAKNGPALAGYGAARWPRPGPNHHHMPEQLRRSLTWDRGKELARTPSSRSPPGSRSTSPTPTAPGSAARTKTPTAFYANTFRRAPTSPAGTQTTSQPSLTPSTPGPAKPSAGEHPPKPSTNTYSRYNKPVLRPPLESAQYTAVRFTGRLARRRDRTPRSAASAIALRQGLGFVVHLL